MGLYVDLSFYRIITAADFSSTRVLVQLAREMGLRVIASCGSEEKVELLRTLGAHHVINRKTDDVATELKKAGPIDIYIDHVGGATLEAAIANAAMHARFVIVGAVSTYNAPISEAYGVRVCLILSDLCTSLSDPVFTESMACISLSHHVSPIHSVPYQNLIIIIIS